jgi:glycine betaine/proline transport system substrate-binding protein
MEDFVMRWKIIGGLGLASIVWAMSPLLALAESDGECGTVTVADMNWNSATFIANLDRFILEHAYGCDAQLVQGDTMPTGTSMVEKGEPNVAPELWSNSFRAAIDIGVAEGRLLEAGRVFSDGGEEGFWVPSYMVAERPELATIQGVIQHAELFKNPEDPSESLFMGCPSGWNCQISGENLFRALGLGEAGFVLGDPGSAAGLDGSLAKAYERGEPWFGYYWAPTSILGKYPMVMVELADFDAAGHTCNTREDCDTPHAGRYPASAVLAVTTKAFADSHPDELAFISNISIPNDVMNAVLAWGEDNQAEGNEMAGYFIVKHEDLWSSWLPADVAAKVKAALK